MMNPNMRDIVKEEIQKLLEAGFIYPILDSEMVNDYMEVFMDDFTPYGNSFDESLKNLEKVLECREQTHLSLRTEKCHIMMRKGIVIGNFISAAGIQVDPTKIKVIVNIPTPGS